MFLSDQPIISSSQDILGRHKFSKYLYEAISNYSDENSLVVALYGDWGSGKTSIINLFQEYFKLSKEETKPIITHFNPWNFSDQNQLVGQFFNILRDELGKTDNLDAAIQIGEKLQLYSKIFTPLTLIPTIGPVAAILSNVFGLVGKTASAVGDARSENVIKIKDELNKELLKLDRKILVIIDDIDRLTSAEIRQVFQLIKKIADFPNTIYLLAEN